MITPIDLQTKSFKSGLGYDKKDVDSFFSELSLSYEMIYKENYELQDKLKQLNENLSHYKTIEKSLQKALILAQKAADDVKEHAKINAKAIEDEARSKARLIVSDSQNQLEQIHNKTLALLNQYDIYRAQYKQLAKAQLEIIESDSFNLNVANLSSIPVKPDSEVLNEQDENINTENQNQESIEENKDQDSADYFTFIDESNK